jgi:DNA-binding protein Fis
MENLKVKVNNQAERKEVQDLFFSLGCEWGVGEKEKILKKASCFIFAHRTGVILNSSGLDSFKEITIQQLRDLVVLKRNSVDDATHVDSSDCKYYQNSNGGFYYKTQNDWIKTNELPGCIKPISKMKEYLRKNEDGEYVLEVADEREAKEPHAKDWIEIREGCDFAYFHPYKKYVYFLPSKLSHVSHKLLWQRDTKPMKEYLVPQGNGKYSLTTANEKRVSDWIEVPEGYSIAVKKGNGDTRFTNEIFLYFGESFIWQRHTQPEELPSMDKSLNDQYTEIEAVRQHKHYFKDVSDIDVIDVYEVLKRFNVTDPCLQHIVKKALCVGNRGHKDMQTDLQDILDTAKRAVEINK